MSTDTDERMAKRREDEEKLRAGLASYNMEGPHRFPSGDVFSLAFSAGRDKFAVCLTCGSMVLLNDPAEYEDTGVVYERSAVLHVRWHEAHDD